LPSPVGVIAVSNEPLELGTRNLVRQYTMNMFTRFVINAMILKYSEDVKLGVTPDKI
jgi:hypothetical protein